MKSPSEPFTSGGTTSKEHTFKPTDPTVTRQDPAVTYLEKVGAGWNIYAPSMVGAGFTLRGSGMSILTLDVPLQGSGLIDFASAATFYPTSTPTVARQTSRVTATAMIRLWPKLSRDSEVCDLIEAFSSRCRFSS